MRDRIDFQTYENWVEKPSAADDVRRFVDLLEMEMKDPPNALSKEGLYYYFSWLVGRRAVSLFVDTKIMNLASRLFLEGRRERLELSLDAFNHMMGEPHLRGAFLASPDALPTLLSRLDEEDPHYVLTYRVLFSLHKVAQDPSSHERLLHIVPRLTSYFVVWEETEREGKEQKQSLSSVLWWALHILASLRRGEMSVMLTFDKMTNQRHMRTSIACWVNAVLLGPDATDQAREFLSLNGLSVVRGWWTMEDWSRLAQEVSILILRNLIGLGVVGVDEVESLVEDIVLPSLRVDNAKQFAQAAWLLVDEVKKDGQMSDVERRLREDETVGLLVAKVQSILPKDDTGDPAMCLLARLANDDSPLRARLVDTLGVMEHAVRRLVECTEKTYAAYLLHVLSSNESARPKFWADPRAAEAIEVLAEMRTASSIGVMANFCCSLIPNSSRERMFSSALDSFVAEKTSIPSTRLGAYRLMRQLTSRQIEYPVEVVEALDVSSPPTPPSSSTVVRLVPSGEGGVEIPLDALVAASPYFASLMGGEWAEGESGRGGEAIEVECAPDVLVVVRSYLLGNEKWWEALVEDLDLALRTVSFADAYMFVVLEVRIEQKILKTVDSITKAAEVLRRVAELNVPLLVWWSRKVIGDAQKKRLKRSSEVVGAGEWEVEGAKRVRASG